MSNEAVCGHTNCPDCMSVERWIELSGQVFRVISTGLRFKYDSNEIAHKVMRVLSSRSTTTGLRPLPPKEKKSEGWDGQPELLAEMHRRKQTGRDSDGNSVLCKNCDRSLGNHTVQTTPYAMTTGTFCKIPGSTLYRWTPEPPTEAELIALGAPIETGKSDGPRIYGKLIPEEYRGHPQERGSGLEAALLPTDEEIAEFVNVEWSLTEQAQHVFMWGARKANQANVDEEHANSNALYFDIKAAQAQNGMLRQEIDRLREDLKAAEEWRKTTMRLEREIEDKASYKARWELMQRAVHQHPLLRELMKQIEQMGVVSSTLLTDLYRRMTYRGDAPTNHGDYIYWDGKIWWGEGSVGAKKCHHRNNNMLCGRHAGHDGEHDGDGWTWPQAAEELVEEAEKRHTEERDYAGEERAIREAEVRVYEPCGAVQPDVVYCQRENGHDGAHANEVPRWADYDVQHNFTEQEPEQCLCDYDGEDIVNVNMDCRVHVCGEREGGARCANHRPCSRHDRKGMDAEWGKDGLRPRAAKCGAELGSVVCGLPKGHRGLHTEQQERPDGTIDYASDRAQAKFAKKGPEQWEHGCMEFPGDPHCIYSDGVYCPKRRAVSAKKAAVATAVPAKPPSPEKTEDRPCASCGGTEFKPKNGCDNFQEKKTESLADKIGMIRAELLEAVDRAVDVTDELDAVVDDATTKRDHEWAAHMRTHSREFGYGEHELCAGCEWLADGGSGKPEDKDG